jgi:hypothetical protein
MESDRGPEKFAKEKFERGGDKNRGSYLDKQCGTDFTKIREQGSEVRVRELSRTHS